MTSGTIEVSLDNLTGQVDKAAGLQPLPDSGTAAVLATHEEAVVARGPQAIDCRTMLSGDANRALRGFAAQQYPALIANPNALSDFGAEALRVINATGSRILHELVGRGGNIPAEVTQITKDLDNRINSLSKKYGQGGDHDLTEAASAYERWSGSIREYFNQFRDVLRMLIRDVRGLESYLQRLVAQLEEKKGELARNVELCNEQYRATEASLGELVKWCAIQEHLLDVAREDLARVKADQSIVDPNLRTEMMGVRSQFIAALEKRLGEFKQGLFISYFDLPQIRNIRAVSYGLAQDLGLLILLTIPIMIRRMTQWIMLEEARQAAETSDAVRDTHNRMLAGLAGAAANLVPELAERSQRPTTDPKVLLLWAESLRMQTLGFVTAYEKGEAARAELDRAFLQGAQIAQEGAGQFAEIVGKRRAMTQTVEATVSSLPTGQAILPPVYADDVAEILPAAA